MPASVKPLNFSGVFFTLFAASTVSMCATITFVGVSTGVALPNPYMEGGFSVTTTAGSWGGDATLGNPAPSIAGSSMGTPGSDALRVTSTSGGLFTFDSVDIDATAAGPVSYTIAGWRNGAEVLSQAGTVNALCNVTPPPPFIPCGFQTISSISPAVFLDALDITLTPHPSNISYNLDNIVLTLAIPEPYTAGVIALAVAAFALVRKRAAA